MVQIHKLLRQNQIKVLRHCVSSDHFSAIFRSTKDRTNASDQSTSPVARYYTHHNNVTEYLLSLHEAGHPVVNDPLYCHPAWGPERGRNGLGIRDIDQVYMHKTAFYDELPYRISRKVQNIFVKSAQLAKFLT